MISNKKLLVKVRSGVFETNSSSTHAICVYNGDESLKLPNKITAKTKYFGWEVNVYSTPEEKLSYLYSAMLDNDYKDEFQKLMGFLEEEGIKVNIIEESEEEYGRIDHSSELNSFVNTMIDNKPALMQFLFSNKSCIVTGNDNGDGIHDIVDIKKEPQTAVFYKGN